MLFNIDSVYLLYNSLSNSFAELDVETYQYLLSLQNGGNIGLLDGDLIKELKTIKAIVEDDLIEIMKIKHFTLCERFSNNGLILTINPTLGCNFACPYCFEKEHNDSKFMSEEVEDKIVKFIKASKKDIVSVTWFGGEPLLGFDCIKRLTNKIQESGIREYHSSMITNGYLLSDDKIRQLDSLNIHSLQITLDGPAKMHNSRRKLRNGGKTFDVIMTNIGKVNELSPNTRVNIRINIDRNNADGVIDLISYIEQMNYSNVAISPAFVNDSTEETRNPCVCDDAEQFSFFIELYKKTGMQVLPFYPSSFKSECAVRNRSSMVIGPEGELYKCWQDVGIKDKIYGYIDGHVTNEKVLLEYLMDADPLDDEECRECLLFPICSGGCPYARIKAQRDSKFSKPCPLYKDKLIDFLTLHYRLKRSQLSQ